MCFGIAGSFPRQGLKPRYTFDCLKTVNPVWPLIYTLPAAARTDFDLLLVNGYKNFTLILEVLNGTSFTNVELWLKKLHPSSFSLGQEVKVMDINANGITTLCFGVDGTLITGEIFDKLRFFIKNPNLIGNISIQTFQLMAQP